MDVTKNLNCQASGCGFEANDVYDLHKHIQWLCIYNKSKCERCKAVCNNSVINHYVLTHDVRNQKITRFVTINNLSKFSFGLSLCRQAWNDSEKKLVIIKEFMHTFIFEIQFINNSLLISVVSAIPTNDVDKFKCTLKIQSSQGTSSIVTYLEMDFTDVSTDDLCRNPSRVDWMINVYFQFIGLKWDCNKNFLDILIQKHSS